MHFIGLISDQHCLHQAPQTDQWEGHWRFCSSCWGLHFNGVLHECFAEQWACFPHAQSMACSLQRGSDSQHDPSNKMIAYILCRAALINRQKHLYPCSEMGSSTYGTYHTVVKSCQGLNTFRSFQLHFLKTFSPSEYDGDSISKCVSNSMTFIIIWHHFLYNVSSLLLTKGAVGRIMLPIVQYNHHLCRAKSEKTVFWKRKKKASEF